MSIAGPLGAIFSSQNAGRLLFRKIIPEHNSTADNGVTKYHYLFCPNCKANSAVDCGDRKRKYCTSCQAYSDL